MGRNKVTIRQVAELAGVSTATVSRYLTVPGKVNATTARRIKDAIDDLHYQPDAFASSLRRGKTNVVGIIVPHAGAFFGDVFRVTCDVLHDEGYLPYICITGNNSTTEQEYVQEMINRHAAGMLIVPSGQNTQYLLSISEEYHNMVLFDRQEFECDTVLTIDHDKDASLLCEHMLTRHPGSRLFAVMGYQYNMTVRQITAGIRSACERTGYDLDNAQLFYNCTVDYAMKDAADAVLASVRRQEKPIVLCYGENFLSSMMLRLGVRENDITGKMYLGGYADPTMADKLGFEYPRIIRDTRECGILAAQMLLERIADPEGTRPPQTRLAGHELILC